MQFPSLRDKELPGRLLESTVDERQLEIQSVSKDPSVQCIRLERLYLFIESFT